MKAIRRFLTLTTSVAIAVAVAVLVSSSAFADDAGGTGSCDPQLGTCGVGTGGSSDAAGAGGGISNADPCAQWPDAPYGSEPPAVSQACADELQGRYCDAIKADALGGVGVGSFADLTMQQIDQLNQELVLDGCPPLVTPTTLAEQAYKTIVFPHPSGSRSPAPDLLYRGYPFTYVMLQTFYWTSPATWKTLSTTASAAGFTATVTARPTELIFDPGDGSAAVSCAGPGRPWTKTDGSGPPADDACAYQYRHVTSSPITSTQSIVWKITWTGTGNAGGQIPQLVTSTSGQLNVMQIQTVVTR